MARRLISDPSNPSMSSPSYNGGGLTMDDYNALRFNIGSQLVKSGKKTSDITAGLGLLEPPEGDENISSMENGLGLVERLWIQNEDKLAMPEAGTKAQRLLHKWKITYEAPPEYELFKRQARGLGARMAKTAGDTGNVALAEQAAQLQSLADADLTKEEARQTFMNVRERLGLQPRDNQYYDALKNEKLLNQGTEQVLPPGQTPPIAPSQPAPTTPRQIEAPRQGALQALLAQEPAPMRSTIPSVAPTAPAGGPAVAGAGTPTAPGAMQGQTMPVNLPGSSAYGELGALGGRFLPLPPGLRVLAGGYAGETLEDVGEKGLPLNREALLEQEFGKPASQVTGGERALRDLTRAIPPLSYFTVPQEREKFNKIIPLAALDVLLSGRNLIGKARTSTAEKLTKKGVKIPGKEIAEPYVKESTKVLGKGTKELNSKIKEIMTKYKGDLDLDTALTRKQAIGRAARNQAGDIKQNIGSGLMDYERMLLNKAVDQRSRLLAALDTIDSLLGRVGGASRSLAGKIGGAGISAIGFGAGMYGMNKLKGEE